MVKNIKKENFRVKGAWGLVNLFFFFFWAGYATICRRLFLREVKPGKGNLMFFARVLREKRFSRKSRLHRGGMNVNFHVINGYCDVWCEIHGFKAWKMAKMGSHIFKNCWENMWGGNFYFLHAEHSVCSIPRLLSRITPPFLKTTIFLIFLIKSQFFILNLLQP